MKFLICVFLLINFTTPVLAETLPSVIRDFGPAEFTFEGRKKLAQNMLREFTALYNAIPTLSPTEAEWLREEYDRQIIENSGRYSKRILDAMDSVPFRKRVSKLYYENYVNDLNLVISSKTSDDRFELSAWAALASDLSDNEGHQAILSLVKSESIDVGEYVGQFKCGVCFVENQRIKSKIILDGIILPFLRGGKYFSPD